jgi:hypothetical protein
MLDLSFNNDNNKSICLFSDNEPSFSINIEKNNVSLFSD